MKGSLIEAAFLFVFHLKNTNFAAEKNKFPCPEVFD